MIFQNPMNLTVNLHNSYTKTRILPFGYKAE